MNAARTDDHVPLRDFIERIIADNNLRRDDLRSDDHRWVQNELNALSKALELQAKEYERRLEDLNHAHELAKDVLGTYLTRELYDRAHAEVLDWQRKADIELIEINNRIKSVELGLVNLPGGIKSLELGLAAQAGQQVGTTATRSSLITIISVIIAAVSVLIGVIAYLNK